MADMLNVGCVRPAGLPARAGDDQPQHRQRLDAGLQPPARGSGHAASRRSSAATALGTGVTVQRHQPRQRRAAVRRRCAAPRSSFSRLDTYAEKAGALEQPVRGQLHRTVARRCSASPMRCRAWPTRRLPLRRARCCSPRPMAWCTRLQTYDPRLDDIEPEVNAQLGGEAASDQQHRRQHRAAEPGNRCARSRRPARRPNDLLDARDAQLADLASTVDDHAWSARTMAQLNVFIGNGQALVLGNNSATLVAQQDPFQPSRVIAGVQVRRTARSISAARSAAAASADCWISAAKCSIRRATSWARWPSRWRMSPTPSTAKAWTCRAIWAATCSRSARAAALAATNNTGTVTAAVTRTSTGALTANDYVLRYDGSAWTMLRADTGAPVTFTGTGTAGRSHRGRRPLDRGERHAGRRRPHHGPADGQRHLGHGRGDHRSVKDRGSGADPHFGRCARIPVRAAFRRGRC